MELLKRRLSELEHIGLVQHLPQLPIGDVKSMQVEVLGSITENRLKAVSRRLGFRADVEEVSKGNPALVLTPLTSNGRTVDPVVSVTFFQGRDLNRLDNNPLFVVAHRGTNMTEEKRKKLFALFKALKPTKLEVHTGKK